MQNYVSLHVIMLLSLQFGVASKACCSNRFEDFLHP